MEAVRAAKIGAKGMVETGTMGIVEIGAMGVAGAVVGSISTSATTFGPQKSLQDM